MFRDIKSLKNIVIASTMCCSIGLQAAVIKYDVDPAISFKLSEVTDGNYDHVVLNFGDGTSYKTTDNSSTFYNNLEDDRSIDIYYVTTFGKMGPSGFANYILNGTKPKFHDSNFTIDSSLTYGGGSTNNFMDVSSDYTNKYIGVKLIGGSSWKCNGSSMYGYIEASYDATTDIMTFHSFAYEDTCGQGISAGATPPPNSAPTDISLSPNTIEENSESGTKVGDLNATDADGGVMTYSLGCTTAGADDGDFSISGTELFNESESLDYETKTYKNICVKVTDSEGASYEENLTILVGNTNDNDPIITTTQNDVNITAGDSFTYTPDGFDADLDSLTWSVSSQPTASWLNITNDIYVGTHKVDVTTPNGVLVDKHGNIYIAETKNTLRKILKVTPDGVVTTVVDYTTATGNGTEYTPTRMVMDSAENLYVTYQSNHIIEKIAPDGTITLFAGSLSSSGSIDGVGSDAKFDEPVGITIDSSGNLFVADNGNNLIRKITPDGNVTTFAGSGESASTDGTGTAAAFKSPYGIGIDSSDNLYVTDALSHKIRKITPEGVVTTFAGSGSQGSTDGVGTAASFYYPYDVQVDSSDNLYVADTGNNKIRKILPDGTVSTYIGTGTGGNVDGFTDVAETNAMAIALDNSGKVVISDHILGYIRTSKQTIKLDGNTTDDDEGSYDITINLSDGENNVTQNFTINVILPNQAPTDINLTASSINELNPDRNATVATLGGTDPDGDAITYSLCASDTGTDNSSFQLIDGNLTLNDTYLNADSQNSYTVCITAEDPSGKTYDENLTITVTDLDNETLTVGDATTGVSCGSSSYTRMEASISNEYDVSWDGGKLEVSITQNNEADDRLTLLTSGDFSIDGSNVLDGETIIGTINETDGIVENGASLIVTFNASATIDIVNALVQAIGYNSAGDPTLNSTKTITYGLTQGNGAYITDISTITIGSSWIPLVKGDGIDPNNDMQANSADTDIIGDVNHASLYVRFSDGGTIADSSDDMVSFKMRIDNPTSDTDFGGVAVVGIDANADGKVDIFLSADGRNNSQAIRIFDPGTGANNSPSTTNFEPLPIGWLANNGNYPMSSDNYKVEVVSASSDPDWNTTTDIGGDGKTDVLVTFSLPLEDIATILALPSQVDKKGNLGPRGTTGISGFSADTAFTTVSFTATQPGPLNGDLNGVNDDTMDSDDTFATLGIMSASSSLNGFCSSKSQVNFSIKEGISTIAQIYPTDPNMGNTPEYSITGGVDSSKFIISEGGEISFASAPDFDTPTDAETNNVYEVTVKITDGTVTEYQTITVTVENVNPPVIDITTAPLLDDPTPVISGSTDLPEGTELSISIDPDNNPATDDNVTYTTTVQENGVYILDLESDEPDSGTLPDLSGDTINVGVTGTSTTTTQTIQITPSPTIVIGTIGGDGIVDSSEESNVTIIGTSTNIANDENITITITDGNRSFTGTTTLIDGAWSIDGFDLSGFGSDLTVTATYIHTEYDVQDIKNGIKDATPTLDDTNLIDTTKPEGFSPFDLPFSIDDLDDQNLTITVTVGGDSGVVTVSGDMNQTVESSTYNDEYNPNLTIAPHPSANTGTADINVSVCDTFNVCVNHSFSITVNAAPSDLNITIPNGSIPEDDITGGMPLDSSDPEDDNITYSLCDNSGDNANFNITDGNLTFNSNASVNYEDKTTYTVCIKATDEFGGVLEKNVTVAIGDANDAPEYNTTAMTPGDGSWELVGNADFSGDDPESISIVMDNNGVPYAVMKDGEADYGIKVMKYNGTSWATVGDPFLSEATVRDNDLEIWDSVYEPSIAFDSNNIPYVAFVDNNDTASSYELTVMKFNGTSWETVGTPRIAPAGIEEIRDPKIVIDSSNVPYVTFGVEENEEYKVSVMKYDGSSWVSVGTPTFNFGNDARDPSIALDSNDVPYIAFLDKNTTTYDDSISVMKYDGNSWVSVGSQSFLADNGHDAGNTKILFDSNNIPYVSYQESGTNSINVMKFNGTIWESVGGAIVSGVGHIIEEDYTDFAFDSNNVPYVTFEDYYEDSSNSIYEYKVMMMKFNGASWEKIGESVTGDVDELAMAIDSNDIPYVLYKDYDSEMASVRKYEISGYLVEVPENQTTVIDLNATDEDGDTLTYAITGGVDSDKFNYDSSNGILTFKVAPNYEDASDSDINNKYLVEFNVIDPEGGVDTLKLSVKVVDINEDPTLESDNLVDTEKGENFNSFSKEFGIDDIDDDNLTITIAVTGDSGIVDVSLNEPFDTTVAQSVYDDEINPELTIEYGTGTGTADINVTLCDTYNACVSHTFSVTVNAAPSDLNITIPNGTIPEDDISAGMPLDGTDPEDDNITYSLCDNSGDNSNFTIVNNELKFDSETSVDYETKSSYTVCIKATDEFGGEYEKNVTVQIGDINEAPSIDTTFENISIQEDNGTVIFDLNISDVEGDDLNLTIESNDTTILTIDSNYIADWITQGNWNGVELDFNTTLKPDANGMVTITITVNDGQLSDTQIFTIDVTPVNDAPTLAPISDAIVYKNTPELNVTLDAFDIDGDELTYSFGPSVDSIDIIEDINISNGVMNIKMSTENLSGEDDINVTVCDPSNECVTRTFKLKILALEFDDGENAGEIKDKGDVQYDENKTVVVFQEDNITVTAPNKPDANGSISHEIDFGDKKVKATSDVNGSVVNITDNGVQTRYEDNTTNTVAEVNATITGKAYHTLDVNGTKTTATSEFVGAITTIKENNITKQIEIETSVEVDTNTTVKVVAKGDGTAEHTVDKGGKITKATSKIVGASTVIKTTGEVETKAPTDVNTTIDGTVWIFEAVAKTASNGKTVTTFQLRNTTTNEIGQPQNTFVPTTPYDAGNEVDIVDLNGTIYFKTTAPVTSELTVE